MKKPVNRFAIFVWAVAAFVTIGQVIVEPYLHYLVNLAAPELRQAPDHYVISVLWILGEIRSGLISGTLLVAAGALIELVDQIRWNTLYRNK